MCGVWGYLDNSGAVTDDQVARSIAALLAHRGPDGLAIQTLGRDLNGPVAVLGHTRLAIIDLSEAAAQPMRNEDGSVVVSFNGEIYNFRELRSELQARGHLFRSRSDTEVIVHAYESFGDDFVKHLDGMFAFALWDERRRRLLLARDRAGKKPLYYAWDGQRFTFASEIKALRACPWVESEIAWERVPQFLALGYVPWPNTMYRQIAEVPPASTMAIDGDGPGEPRSYWNLRFGSGDQIRISFQEAASVVRDLLRNAVKRRLVSDVPLGILLSGGIDSSGVMALVDPNTPIRTFTVGVEGDASYDERRFARAVAGRFQREHTEIEIRADAAELLEQLVWHLDQPLSDSSVVPTYLIARAASEHVTVALTGDGGDEVFGGYERFAAALLAERLPTGFQNALRYVARLLPRGEGYFNVQSRIERFAQYAEISPQDQYRQWISVFTDPLLSRVVAKDLWGEVARLETYRSLEAAYEDAGEVPLLHRLLYTNFRTYLHDDLLVKIDRMTMANSLEARCPFLDTTLVDYVGALPPEMKVTRFGLKRLLRRALNGLLPSQILRRRKHGFGVPVNRWFRHELKDQFEETVLSSDARSSSAIDQSAAAELFREHLNETASYGPQLWSLLVLETWLRMQEKPVSDWASGSHERRGSTEAVIHFAS
jgi:asparagine synthase (glutamine-hydrolysing)